jgi:hypothetical protein
MKMLDDYSTFIAAVLALATGLVTYVNKGLKTKLNKKSEENYKLKDNIYQSKIKTIKEMFDFQRFSALEKYIRTIFKDSRIDRFTIMFVMNGKIDFNYMTAIFDQSKTDLSIGNISPYARFPIDESYVNMLHKMEDHIFIWRSHPDFNVGQMGEYIKLEGIKQIGWGFIKRLPIDEFNDLLVFSSFSTSDEKPLTKMEKRRVELVFTGRMLGEIEQILKVPNLKDDELLRHIDKPN